MVNIYSFNCSSLPFLLKEYKSAAACMPIGATVFTLGATLYPKIEAVMGKFFFWWLCFYELSRYSATCEIIYINVSVVLTVEGEQGSQVMAIVTMCMESLLWGGVFVFVRMMGNNMLYYWLNALGRVLSLILKTVSYTTFSKDILEDKIMEVLVVYVVLSVLYCTSRFKLRHLVVYWFVLCHIF